MSGEETVLENLVKEQSLVNVHRDDGVVAQADNLFHLTADKAFYCGAAHLGCKHTVAERRRAAALDVRGTCEACLDAGAFLNCFAKLFAVVLSHAFAENDNEIALAVLARGDHLGKQRLVVGGKLGYYRSDRRRWRY